MKTYFYLLFILLLVSCSGSHGDGKANLYEQENIRSYQVYRYKYDNGTVDTISTIYREPISSYEFYKNGEVKQYTLFINDPSMKSAERTHKFTYKNGGIQEELYTSAGVLTERSVAKTVDGVKTKETFNTDEVLISRELTYFDAEGRDTLSILYGENGKIAYKYVNRYDSIGLKLFFWEDQTLFLSVKAERVNNDAHQRIFEQYEDGVLTSKSTETYEDGKLIELSKVGDEGESIDKYFYYDNGLSKEQISYSKDGTPIYYTKWFYKKW